MDTKYLEGWDIEEQTRRAYFMQHLYKCSGRKCGTYTGLWQEFCLKEAGPYARDVFFERLQAQYDYEQMLIQQREQELQEAEDFKQTIQDLASELGAIDERREEAPGTPSSVETEIFINGFHD